jgi:hypothetical protein
MAQVSSIATGEAAARWIVGVGDTLHASNAGRRHAVGGPDAPGEPPGLLGTAANDCGTVDAAAGSDGTLIVGRGRRRGHRRGLIHRRRHRPPATQDQSMNPVDDKSALITGGRRGIGRASAMVFSLMQGCWAVIDVNECNGVRARRVAARLAFVVGPRYPGTKTTTWNGGVVSDRSGLSSFSKPSW